MDARDATLEADNHDIYRGWLLVEQVRAVYQAAHRDDAMALLDDWILAALTSDLDLFIRCALTIDTHRDLVVNAITERLSNARLERMNSTVRLLSHRARGYRRLTSLLAIDQAGVRPDPRAATHLNARRAAWRG